MKWTLKPSYMAQKMFDNHLVDIHKFKTTLTLNKSVYAGICILELSKLAMYKFHYDYIKSKYGSKLRLLFTDSSNLVFEFETENVYDNFCKNK